MRSISAIAAVFAISSCQGAHVCYAPMPALDRCAPCADFGFVQRGRCVTGNQRSLCYRDQETCCTAQDILVSPADCVLNTKAEAAATLLDSFDQECSMAVSKVPNHYNSECVSACQALVNAKKDPQKEDSFSSQCAFERYEIVNGNVEVLTKCFNQMIYGYSESTHASYRSQSTKTAGECQELCQRDSNCSLFQFTAADVPTSNEDKASTCRLKTMEMVLKPLSYHFVTGNEHYDVNFCNYNQGFMCIHGGQDCMNCQGVSTCVWRSAKHVSGWKYCSDDLHVDPCVIPPDPEPADGTTTESVTTMTADDQFSTSPGAEGASSPSVSPIFTTDDGSTRTHVFPDAPSTEGHETSPDATTDADETTGTPKIHPPHADGTTTQEADLNTSTNDVHHPSSTDTPKTYDRTETNKHDGDESHSTHCQDTSADGTSGDKETTETSQVHPHHDPTDAGGTTNAANVDTSTHHPTDHILDSTPDPTASSDRANSEDSTSGDAGSNWMTTNYDNGNATSTSFRSESDAVPTEAPEPIPLWGGQRVPLEFVVNPSFAKIVMKF